MIADDAPTAFIIDDDAGVRASKFGRPSMPVGSTKSKSRPTEIITELLGEPANAPWDPLRLN